MIPLHQATCSNFTEIVDLLVKNGANIDELDFSNVFKKKKKLF
jgi:ankyrin repeat protein